MRAPIMAVSLALSAPGLAHAQTSNDAPRMLAVEVTPIGALPPLALPMPAGRNYNYWGGRLQAGYRRGRDGAALQAIAGGIDFQWQGGSVFGLTGGYQARACEPAGAECGGHALLGARARFNFITGGPTIAAFVGDYSATTTLGAELGLGFAPNAIAQQHACTLDLGVPLSLAMRQHTRIVTYVTPAVAWDVDCSDPAAARRATYLTGLGIGAQQLGGRALDVYLGAQKIYQSGTGYQIGVSVTYIRMPSRR